MKKFQFSQLILSCLIGILIYSCSKEQLDSPLTSEKTTIELLHNETFNDNTNPGSAIIKSENNLCGDYMSGFYDQGGYHIYPLQVLDLTCIAEGEIVNVVVTALDVPNRFDVLDGNNLLVSSGWVGFADYPGPWGQNLAVPSPLTISFTKGSSDFYTLRVETVAPLPNQKENQADEWYAYLDCECPAPEPINDCGSFYDGSFLGGYHIYNETINLAGIPEGCTINVTVYALDVPNRFDILDGGSLLISSGWLGYADYPGPWGWNIAEPSPVTISFVKGTSDTYTLRVETVTPPDQYDYWHAVVSCDCSSDPGGSENDCEKTFENSYSNTEGPDVLYEYTQVIDLSDVPSGCKIRIIVDAITIPNLVSIEDVETGEELAASEWVGFADYEGPWGDDLAVPSPQSFFFFKGEDDLYTLSVLTYFGDNATDKWQVKVQCICS